MSVLRERPAETWSQAVVSTTPTQWITLAHVTLRVVGLVFLAVSGRRFPGGDPVPEGELLGADEDVFDQQRQHPLPLRRACGGCLSPLAAAETCVATDVAAADRSVRT